MLSNAAKKDNTAKFWQKLHVRHVMVKFNSGVAREGTLGKAKIGVRPCGFPAFSVLLYFLE
jgi:hypothetical protein